MFTNRRNCRRFDGQVGANGKILDRLPCESVAPTCVSKTGPFNRTGHCGQRAHTVGGTTPEVWYVWSIRQEPAHTRHLGQDEGEKPSENPLRSMLAASTKPGILIAFRIRLRRRRSQKRLCKVAAGRCRTSLSRAAKQDRRRKCRLYLAGAADRILPARVEWWPTCIEAISCPLPILRRALRNTMSLVVGELDHDVS